VAKLELVRNGKVIRLDTNVLVTIERELIAFTRKWQRAPAAILMGPPEYLSLVAEFEKQTGHKPPRSQQMMFCSVPAVPKSKPGWDFMLTPDLTYFFVPGVMQGEDEEK
jgi:hypothetical protein